MIYYYHHLTIFLNTFIHFINYFVIFLLNNLLNFSIYSIYSIFCYYLLCYYYYSLRSIQTPYQIFLSTHILSNPNCQGLIIMILFLVSFIWELFQSWSQFTSYFNHECLCDCWGVECFGIIIVIIIFIIFSFNSLSLKPAIISMNAFAIALMN
jgi:hypothetical protein